jgi:calcium-dependent protein kinase
MTKLTVKKLKAFSDMNTLKKAALTVISSQLDVQSIEGLKNTFLSIDKNMDGVVSMAELKNAIVKAGVAIPENLQELFNALDTDGSGVLDYTEFLASTLDKKVWHQEEVIWAAFKRFDLDGSGAVDKQELAKVLGTPEVQKALHLDGQNGQSHIEEIFASVDVNKDGLIQFGEFFDMVVGQQERSIGNLDSSSGYACSSVLACPPCTKIETRPAEKAGAIFRSVST